MPCSFRDETSTTTVMGGGSAGSWEFGAGTPSATAGVVSVDGVLLNTTSGFFLAGGLAASTSLNRTTGTITVAGSQGTGNIDTSSKSDYVVFSWAVQNVTIYPRTIDTTVIQMQNLSTAAGSLSVTYSWL